MKLCCIILAIIMCITLCSCGSQPAYMTPYEDGSPLRPVTASSIHTRVTETTTTTTNDVTAETTESAETTTTVAIPEGHRLCPECGGEKLICPECKGLGKAPESIIEYIDEDSGVFIKKGDPCIYCEEDPGFQYCDTCDNNLHIPITTKTTS